MARSNFELERITETLAEDVFDHLLHGIDHLGLTADEVECSESFRMILMKMLLQYHSAIALAAGPRAALLQLRETFKEVEIHALAI